MEPINVQTVNIVTKDKVGDEFVGAQTWTQEDMDYLEDNWGVRTMPGIAKKLNRSELAIRLKAQRMNLGSFMQGGELISVCQLIKALGLFGSYSWIKTKYIQNGLPISYKKVSERKIAKVDLDKFWKWAEKNKQILNFAKFDDGNLGTEPLWVAEKRRADKSNPSKINGEKLWTKEQDTLLIEKTKSCRYTYKDLAKEFKRTENAIKRRLHGLKVPYRPVPLNNHIKWTDEENKLMIELHQKGYDNYAIAQTLNKTHLSISDRLKKVGAF